MKPSVLNELRARMSEALGRVAGDASLDPVVRATGGAKFGDYQCNAAMQTAKALGSKPRDVAERLIAAAPLSDVAERVEVAGPGFINIHLSAAYLSRRLEDTPAELTPAGRAQEAGEPAWRGLDRVGIDPTDAPQRVVIDYSSPNIAKQMHVGHLRGTILGDCLARTLEFIGHTVIRQNHVGDWGTQFGKLIAWYRDRVIPDGVDGDAVLDAIEADYREANQRFDADPEFAARARAAVGRLQGGEAEARQVWLRLVAISQRAFNDVYARLGASLTDADVRGESFYNDKLAAACDELQARFGAEQSTRMQVRPDQGALCVFLYDESGAPAFRNPEGGAFPMMIRKSDGAFLYASTDLAALRFRMSELCADRVIYVVGNEQSRHLQMLFQVARHAGWAKPQVRLEHAGHGLVLGADGRKLTGRAGGAVHLRSLLDEAVERARAIMAQRAQERAMRLGDADEPPAEGEPDESTARVVGVGAIKYADLSHDRNTDYRFDWDKLLALRGNTAPYLLYAYARVRSIYRRAAEKLGASESDASGAAVRIGAPSERALALRLIRFQETIEVVAGELTPNVLCNYLYELAGDFMRFYEECPVVAAEDEAVRRSRLRLCDLSARTLRLGLSLLGIQTVERL